VRNEAIKDASTDVVSRIDSLQYHLYRKTFDPETKTFGPREKLRVNSQLSLVLPRISPDGRYLLFTTGCHGYFHIWHHDADLWLMDLQTGDVRPLAECNSNDTESYHSWSSNGRWLIFSSRRDDGSFTRPFIAHFDKDGKATKPFELPTEDPDYHRQFMRSYNIPGFMRGPVTVKPQTFADVLKGDGVSVKYVPKLNPKK
jgi:dipeptidyl aminopeptidase/acylaminoacyl peptidase